MDEVFNNILEQRSKIHITGGRVQVGRTPGSPCWLSVNISGAGISMSPTDQARRFGELFRAEQTKKMSEKDTGLGLVIVKEVMESLGGHLEIASQEGLGTPRNLPAACGRQLSYLKV
ncbi:hypothetical protein DFAR_1100002 [Desulfarculales bacterium]